ncbi:hypothetical protein [Georgenia satyanarayanai]|uniref:hypothetical protein n=1 Tax=Georgenia satyanarayanai TaxID=860221 RepID=UPI001264F248|nr:hypothetical protein [Georgenia satyanarayanai]
MSHDDAGPQIRTRLRRREPRFPLAALWGALLVAGGVLLLLEELDLVTDARFFWAGAFAAVGGVFAAAFLLGAEAWWAAIPSGALFGLAVTTALGDPVGDVAEAVSGGAFLGLLGAGFWAVYLRERGRWWSMIPGGALATFGATGALGALGLSSNAQGAVLFLGLGLTFLLVAVLPTGGGRNRWALIPGGILTALGLLIAAGAGEVLELLGYLWPVVLIGAGILLLWRTTTRNRHPR